MAPDDVLIRLAEAAQQQRRSLGDLVREALEEKANQFVPPAQSFGAFRSGGGNPSAAELHEHPVEYEH